MALAGVLGLAACATPADDPSLTPAQRQLQQSNQQFATTVVEGAALGAALGAAAGAITGGGRSAGTGALIGGVVGTTLGLVVASLTKAQAGTEQTLTDQIENSRKAAEAARQSAQASRQIAADARGKIAVLDAQYRSGSLTAAAYRQQMASYHDSERLMQSQLGKMREETDTLQKSAQAASASDRSQLQSAEKDIEQSRREQERALDALHDALSEVPAG